MIDTDFNAEHFVETIDGTMLCHLEAEYVPIETIIEADRDRIGG
jgi:hypothetical protein